MAFENCLAGRYNRLVIAEVVAVQTRSSAHRETREAEHQVDYNAR